MHVYPHTFAHIQTHAFSTHRDKLFPFGSVASESQWLNHWAERLPFRVQMLTSPYFVCVCVAPNSFQNIISTENCI